MLIKRSHEPEFMDDFSINDARIDNALNELKIINKYLGGNSTTKSGFRKLTKDNNYSGRLNILDIGAGGSDNIQINKPTWGEVRITCLDINLRSCRYVKNNNLSDFVICGDALNLPFKESSFHIVHASLFLHHFENNNINKILNESIIVSKLGIIINDLQRSVLAFIGIKLLTFLFSRSILVRNDAPLSVKRGFKKSELIQMVSSIKYSTLILKWYWAFRWLLVIKK